MDKIDKALAKIPLKQRKLIIQATTKIIFNDLSGMDVKKIKGSVALFRVRVGDYRIIFNKVDAKRNIITMIAKRNEKTYKDL